MTVSSHADRACPGCGNGMPGRLRHCPSCGRFVSGGAPSRFGVGTTAGLLLALVLVALAVVGYVWVPLLGTAAHVMLWGLALSQYGGGVVRRFVSITLFPVSLLWYDRDQDDVEIRPWLFWFGVLAILLATALITVLIWYSEGRSGR